ncbi:TniQ family protein (plasmid) [Ureibacillus chungkukjangi]|uniref:TniQ family protein n=1 Tax=Ureibacillus chungkukjangi TaxID=1202712 RepID=UPI000D3A1E57|nr:TniQ family protein [Ureibacillus chungkukjangi]MCM3390533.1 TniQ family protein [Ureibacillus chungkukjangi]HCG4536307.1 TniQ family protein [Salmonella enterica subsp. enterica serovar Typhi str. AG3]
MKTSFEFPIGLEYLVKEIKIFSPMYNKKYFFDYHTNIPVIKAFRPKWKDDLESKNYKIHNLFGSKINDVKVKESLYYCSECLREQLEINGEGYWNRLHQIPGVYICTIHQVLLDYYSINT